MVDFCFVSGLAWDSSCGSRGSSATAKPVPFSSILRRLRVVPMMSNLRQWLDMAAI